MAEVEGSTAEKSDGEAGAAGASSAATGPSGTAGEMSNPGDPSDVSSAGASAPIASPPALDSDPEKAAVKEGADEPKVPPMPVWRWWLLILCWTLPALGSLALKLTHEPPAFRWDPLQPGEVAARYAEAQLALKQQNLPGAEQLLSNLRDENPLNPLIHALLGQVYREQGRREEAMAATRLALERDPQLGEAWFNLACDQQTLGRSEEAFESLRRAQAAGVELKTALVQEPLLKSWLDDRRVQVLLAGAHHLPAQDVSVWLQVTPRNPVPGQRVLVTLEALALTADSATTTLEPSLQLNWRGAEQFSILQPRRRTFEQSRGALTGHHFARWSLQVELVATGRGVERLGPWSVVLNGANVPLASQDITVLPLTLTLSSGPLTNAGSSSGGVETAPGGANAPFIPVSGIPLLENELNVPSNEAGASTAAGASADPKELDPALLAMPSSLFRIDSAAPPPPEQRY